MFNDDNEFICTDLWCNCPHKPMPVFVDDAKPKSMKDYAVGIKITL